MRDDDDPTPEQSPVSVRRQAGLDSGRRSGRMASVDEPRPSRDTDELIADVAHATATAVAAKTAGPCAELEPRVVELERFARVARNVIAGAAAAALSSVGVAWHSVSSRAAAEERVRVELERVIRDVERLSDRVYQPARQGSALPLTPAGGLPVSVLPSRP